MYCCWVKSYLPTSAYLFNFLTYRYKDRRLIQPGRHYTISYEEGVCTLYIREIFMTDQGHYMCKAENKAGSAFTEARVKVQRTFVYYSRISNL